MFEAPNTVGRERKRYEHQNQKAAVLPTSLLEIVNWVWKPLLFLILDYLIVHLLLFRWGKSINSGIYKHLIVFSRFIIVMDMLTSGFMWSSNCRKNDCITHRNRAIHKPNYGSFLTTESLLPPVSYRQNHICRQFFHNPIFAN